MRKLRLGARTIWAIPNHLVMILLVVVAITPCLVLLFDAFKTNNEYASNPLGPPRALHWENFPKAWIQGNFSTSVPNSAFLVAVTITGVLFFGGMAAYALARLNLPETNVLMLYLLGVSSLPIQLFLVPLFFLWLHLGLINTLPGLAIIYIAINAPFAIFLMRSYIVQLPMDFDDAARVDGANEFQIFTSIILPLSWPAFLTTGLVVGLHVWNEIILASIFIQKPERLTVMASYYRFAGQFNYRDYAMTSASAIMMVAPIIILFMLLQRRFIDGLTQGGLKF